MQRAPDDPALHRLRTELSRLFKCEWQEQYDKIKELRAIYPHSIRAVTLEPEVPVRTYGFGCFAFAFQLFKWNEYFDFVKEMNAFFTPWMITEFMNANALVEKPAGDEGDLAIYSTDSEITHAGIVRGARVHSKWGTTFLWGHGTFEIPAEY